VGGVRHPQHTQTGSNSSTIAADSSNCVTNTRCCRCSLCAPDDRWKYHPKHVEQFPDINELCNFVSCWIYYGILLAHPVLHISRIRVNRHKTGRETENLYNRILSYLVSNTSDTDLFRFFFSRFLQ
jgi:hypothetical protein